MAIEKKIKKVLRVDKQDYSGLSAFVERPIPSEKEVATFDRVVNREARNQEIDNNLSEIYKDRKGSLVDVKKMKIRKRRLFVIRFFRNILLITILVGLAYFAYSYFFDGANDSSSLTLEIIAPAKVAAGESFNYKINYHNPSKFNLTKVHLEIQYPQNFIMASSSIPAQNGNYGWNLPDIEPGASASLEISGYLINLPDAVNVISARLSYMPLNYSSQFKKEASVSTIISDPGFQVNLESSKTAFIGQDNNMTLTISEIKNNYLGDFNLSFSLPAETNAQAITTASSSATSSDAGVAKVTITKAGGTSWVIGGLNSETGRVDIPLSYRIRTKIDNPNISVRLEKKMEDGQAYIFWEKTINPELVKSDLNLTLSLNGNINDSAVNFGQTLNYAISYNNKGSNTFSDVVLMAALDGEFLDLKSLSMEKPGEVSGQSIIWTKNEIPELGEIKPGQEGVINFSLKLLNYRDGDIGKNMIINAYAQYGVNNQTIKGEDNRSNTINSVINSDLSLDEKILYFNEDNLPVGSGPLPPKVGETSGFRVYWVIKNNLHELAQTKVELDLPAGVNWDYKNSANAGSVVYDAALRRVTWEIGRLPVSVYQVNAEFGISVTPNESDRNKILILSPGSSVSAIDSETNSTIIKKIESKTTRLEDDDIAGLNNNGRVQ